MKTQKTLNSKNINNLEKEEQKWMYHAPWLQTTLQSYQNKIILAQKQTQRSMVQNRESRSKLSSVQSLSVSDSLQPMNRSTPGLPVHHQLPESTQTHIHVVDDATQPSHPLSSPSPPALNLSQQQGLFKWVSSSHQVARVLEFQLQHQSFQWTPKTDLL